MYGTLAPNGTTIPVSQIVDCHTGALTNHVSLKKTGNLIGHRIAIVANVKPQPKFKNQF